MVLVIPLKTDAFVSNPHTLFLPLEDALVIDCVTVTQATCDMFRHCDTSDMFRHAKLVQSFLSIFLLKRSKHLNQL